MANVLIIAYDYPPILSPEAIQSQRFAKALSKNNNVYLLSVSNPDFETIDNNLIDKSIEVFRTKKPIFEKLYHIFYKLVDIVDRKFWWRNIAYKKAKQIIDEKKIDIVVTRSVPISDHFVGLKLKQNFNIKWIAHFSDPWSLNPYNFKNRFIKFIEQKLEKKIVLSADEISVTSIKTKELFLSLYLNLKIKVNYHLFDKKLYPDIETKNSKIVITHTGNIYGLRSIKPLIKFAKNIDNLEFRFYGKVDKKEQKIAPANFKFFGQVDYLTSLKVMKEADYLLIIEPFLDNSPFFPSKLVDYIGANRPIFLLGSPTSTSADILRFIGCQNSIIDEKVLQNLPKCNLKNVDIFDLEKVDIRL